MSNTLGFFRKQLPESEPIEYMEMNPERESSIQELKRLYDSRGTNNSTLSNSDDDSDRIKS